MAVPLIFDFLLFTVAVAKEDLLRTPLELYHTQRTIQMRYIEIWQRKPQATGLLTIT